MIDFKKSGLLVVDVQRGFLSELPVPEGKKAIPTINKLLALPWARIDATADWHPEDHCSFTKNGGRYPRHCVANTEGAMFVWEMDSQKFHAVWRKGFDPKKEAY